MVKNGNKGDEKWTSNEFKEMVEYFELTKYGIAPEESK